MEKPVLVIMAAGMGSRYGGLKQIDPVDQDGHIIIDFSLYDAHRAGFETAIFIIKKENEEDFKRVIGNRIESIMNIHYVYQSLDDLPIGYHVPEGRIKPWGTAHAIYCCRDIIHGPFAVINADDYYGVQAFSMIYDYLSLHTDDHHYAMVGYQIENTLSDHGTVARGICEVDENNDLKGIVERTKIMRVSHGVAYTEDDHHWTYLAEGTTVSMNLWGFSLNIMEAIKKEFKTFLDKDIKKDPLKCEYFIPSVVSHLIENKKVAVRVLETSEKWYGVTYKEDKPVIMDALQRMKDAKLYPQRLWGDDSE